MKKPHHSTIRRLAFSKYLYMLAVQQSHLPEIQAAASLLSFHDSIEMFLQIASEHLNAGKSQPAFIEYWDILQPKLKGVELPQKESMRRLSKARASLKHGGTLPSELDIESFRVSTTQFFAEASPIVFGLEFYEISLVEYVSNKEVRTHLKDAIELSKNKDYEKATSEVALAYEKLIDTYTASSKLSFSFGRDMTFLSASSLGIRRGQGFDRIAEFVDAVRRSITDLQDAVLILALGIDYKKYVRFRSHLPFVHRPVGGHYFLDTTRNRASGVGGDYIEFCIMFVIECAIRLDRSKTPRQAMEEQSDYETHHPFH